MTKEFPYTFDYWNKGQCSEVKHIDPESVPDYQSEYMFMYNYLRDRGWMRVAKRWVSPYPPHHTYGHIHLAYGSQKYKESVDESTD